MLEFLGKIALELVLSSIGFGLVCALAGWLFKKFWLPKIDTEGEKSYMVSFLTAVSDITGEWHDATGNRIIGKINKLVKKMLDLVLKIKLPKINMEAHLENANAIYEKLHKTPTISKLNQMVEKRKQEILRDLKKENKDG